MDQRGMVPRNIGLASVTLEFDCLALWPVVGLPALATQDWTQPHRTDSAQAGSCGPWSQPQRGHLSLAAGF